MSALAETSTIAPVEEERPSGSEETEPELGEEELELDIQEELEQCLESEWKLSSTFSYNHVYKGAPNPALNLTDIGTIGLPLSKREADVITNHAQQAPFGMGERTLVDKSVRDTWEMDAQQISFGNPEWPEFMEKVVHEVCTSLGVNIEASKPRCDLYKLLLYETGSHFLPHVDTEKADGMFATIVVVLPSQFTGGTAHLSHSGLSATYDCSATSLYHTAVMSWYTDVTHEIKPITSGYRLALTYNLYHTTTSLRPSLSTSEGSVDQLRRIFRAWNQDNGYSAPNQIVYLLEHKYSQANLRASAMKGVDAHKVAALDLLSKEFGFHLGLATVECTESGEGEDMGGYGWNRRRRGYYDGGDDPDPQHMDFCVDAEIEHTMVVKNLVDLNGEHITKVLPVDQERDTIPENLNEIVEEGQRDGAEYEGYMGNYAGTLSRFYRRTVLVIWPHYNNFAIQYGENNVPRACQSLAKITTTAPSADDTALADFVLSRAAKLVPTDVVQAVTRVALRWNDPSLWVRAVRACSVRGKGLAMFPQPQPIFDALALFGTQDILPCLDALVKDDIRNVGRLEFLDALERWTASQSEPSPDLVTTLNVWITSSREVVLSTLQTPTQQDLDAFISLALKNGSITYLTDRIMPQITASSTNAFLRELALKAYDETRFADSTEVKTRVSAEIMNAAITRTTFNDRSARPSASTHRGYLALLNNMAAYTQPKTKTNFDNAKAYLLACWGKFDHLVVQILDKVADIQLFTPSESQKQVKDVMLPLLQIVAENKQAGLSETVAPAVSRLLRTAVDAYVKTIEPTASSTEAVRSLVRTMDLPGGPEIFVASVLPKVESHAFPPTTMREFIQELRSPIAPIVLPATYTGPKMEAMVALCAKHYATTAPLPNVQAISAVLQYCLETGALEACTIVIRRIVAATLLTSTYVSTVLVPFIPELRRLALQHNKLDGFAPAFQTIVLAWIEKVLGRKPDSDGSAQLASIPAWTCPCPDCTSARNFLKKASVDRNLYLYSIGAVKRRHVEDFLNRYARSACTWRTIGRSPQGLQIIKSDEVYRPGRWNADRDSGNAILKTVSEDENELRRILGPHYGGIVTLIRGTAPPALYSTQTSAARTSAQPEVEPPSKRRKTEESGSM
ncbi:hypothetical protein EIP91_010651 [Steccherinum ochraceum]|uniref:Prolyl 4-hydroxylase alpha subunit Fe(2+) 2OG dioxygenase domain-containing protein n=1 Tax=Steccherinum ochraceum TaxID=92696 RepID=A0A4R0RLN4_9APHY|nr:hypothetical protein EIP91_010651 [Steccherinum ochraceum]